MEWVGNRLQGKRQRRGDKGGWWAEKTGGLELRLLTHKKRKEHVLFGIRKGTGGFKINI